MKKIALTSLLAVFAAAGANAANVIDGNPLYMPTKGNFYSVTDLYSHSETTKDWTLGEEFGYGITDKLAVAVSTDFFEGAEEAGDDEAFDTYGLGNVALTATFRAFEKGAWKVDAYGKYATEGATIFGHSDIADDTKWFDEDLIDYRWTAGVRGGYTTPVFTVAGHIAYEYVNAESFNWGDYGEHVWKLGVDGQYVINNMFNVVGGVEYAGISNDKEATYTEDKSLVDVENAGTWHGYLGVNYNIDATKYVGAYISGDMRHWKDNGEKGWEAEDGFGFGAKFGIQF